MWAASWTRGCTDDGRNFAEALRDAIQKQPPAITTLGLSDAKEDTYSVVQITRQKICSLVPIPPFPIKLEAEWCRDAGMQLRIFVLSAVPDVKDEGDHELEAPPALAATSSACNAAK